MKTELVSHSQFIFDRHPEQNGLCWRAERLFLAYLAYYFVNNLSIPTGRVLKVRNRAGSFDKLLTVKKETIFSQYPAMEFGNPTQLAIGGTPSSLVDHVFNNKTNVWLHRPLDTQFSDVERKLKRLHGEGVDVHIHDLIYSAMWESKSRTLPQLYLFLKNWATDALDQTTTTAPANLPTLWRIFDRLREVSRRG